MSHVRQRTFLLVAYGGVMGATEPFSMKLNRPFVFLVADSTTDALLFLGAVVDPSLN